MYHYDHLKLWISVDLSFMRAMENKNKRRARTPSTMNEQYSRNSGRDPDKRTYRKTIVRT